VRSSVAVELEHVEGNQHEPDLAAVRARMAGLRLAARRVLALLGYEKPILPPDHRFRFRVLVPVDHEEAAVVLADGYIGGRRELDGLKASDVATLAHERYEPVDLEVGQTVLEPLVGRAENGLVLGSLFLGRHT
jgi:hypothetical protein